jgi:hypothetical protein
VRQTVLKGVNPGSDTLSDLLYQFGPCLITIDELVAYARNLYGVDRLPAGSFDSIMSFIQSLTEAVKRSDESMLLIALPESDIEIGGEAGLAARNAVVDAFGDMYRNASGEFPRVRRRPAAYGCSAHLSLHR